MDQMQLRPRPVFLYFDPHPVHEKMANHVDAEMIQCETGGVAARVRSAVGRDFGDRPLILEGGVPLFEGAIIDLLGGCGPLIALGADSTYDDLADPMESRSRASRLAHRVSQFFVDGTLAVSERIATLAERFAGAPVRLVHPFVEAERRERLQSLNPKVTGTRILCLGKYREKNGQDLLRTSLDHVNTDVTIDFVGPDTERIRGGDGIHTHGFVSEDRLIELFDHAALMVFPAPVGAFPVATLEALSAGLPPVVTPRIGTATLVRGVHGRLVADPEPVALARAIEWYFDRSVKEREKLAQRARGLGAGFTEAEGLDAFEFELRGLLADLDYEVIVDND